MITSAPRIASRMSWVRVTPGAMLRQLRAAAATPGRTAPSSAPNFDSRWMFDRATRLCAMSPMIATRRPSSVGAVVQNRQRVEQRLRRMLVRAVAGVDDRCRQIARQKMRRARSRVAHHDRVGMHGRQGVQRVHQRLALVDAGARRRDGDCIRAQPLGGDLEAGARARRGLEEQIHHHPAAQQVDFLQRLLLVRLKILGAVENGLDLAAIERLDSQQSDPASVSPSYALSTSSTFSIWSTSWNFTSMISLALVCTMRPT